MNWYFGLSLWCQMIRMWKHSCCSTCWTLTHDTWNCIMKYIMWNVELNACLRYCWICWTKCCKMLTKWWIVLRYDGNSIIERYWTMIWYDYYVMCQWWHKCWMNNKNDWWLLNEWYMWTCCLFLLYFWKWLLCYGDINLLDVLLMRKRRWEMVPSRKKKIR